MMLMTPRLRASSKAIVRVPRIGWSVRPVWLLMFGCIYSRSNPVQHYITTIFGQLTFNAREFDSSYFWKFEI